MSFFERVDRTQRRPLSSRHRPHAIPPTNPRLRRQTHGGLEGTEHGLHLIARQLRDIAVLDDPDEQRVLPSSSVGEESLSPNYPDTSS